MALGVNRVQVTKVESTALGGDDSDMGPHGADPLPIDAQEDAVESAGIYLQDGTNRDENVYICRDDDDLSAKDEVLPSQRSLYQFAHGWRIIPAGQTFVATDGFDVTVSDLTIIDTGALELEDDGGSGGGRLVIT